MGYIVFQIFDQFLNITVLKVNCYQTAFEQKIDSRFVIAFEYFHAIIKKHVKKVQKNSSETPKAPSSPDILRNHANLKKSPTLF